MTSSPDDTRFQGISVPPVKGSLLAPTTQASFLSNCLFQCFAPMISVFAKNEKPISYPTHEQKSLLGHNRMGYESEEDEFASTLYGETDITNEAYALSYSSEAKTADKNGFTSFAAGGLESILTPDEMREWSSYRDTNYKNLETTEEPTQGSEVEVTDQTPIHEEVASVTSDHSFSLSLSPSTPEPEIITLEKNEIAEPVESTPEPVIVAEQPIVEEPKPVEPQPATVDEEDDDEDAFDKMFDNNTVEDDTD